MGDVTKEIETALKELNIDSGLFRRLGKEENEQLYKKLLSRFVNSGDRRWWWEDFKLPSYQFEEHPDKLIQLKELLENVKDNVWFMPEDDENNFYPIYDADPKLIPDILGECSFFEYYIIGKNENWLICENHHDYLIGVNSISG